MRGRRSLETRDVVYVAVAATLLVGAFIILMAIVMTHHSSKGAAMTNLEYLSWLKEDCRYDNIKVLSDKRWAATNNLMYTVAILIGEIGDRISVLDRWCYENEQEAKVALEAWDGVGEPTGWVRHPFSGRRRDKTGEEWINL